MEPSHSFATVLIRDPVKKLIKKKLLMYRSLCGAQSIESLYIDKGQVLHRDVQSYPSSRRRCVVHHQWRETRRFATILFSQMMDQSCTPLAVALRLFLLQLFVALCDEPCIFFFSVFIFSTKIAPANCDFSQVFIASLFIINQCYNQAMRKKVHSFLGSYHFKK